MDTLEVVNRLLLIINLLRILQYLIIENEKISTRRWWTLPHLHKEERAKYGAFATVFSYFRLNNEIEFLRFCGLTVAQFAYLSDLVEPLLRKNSRRESLTPEFKLAAVLK